MSNIPKVSNFPTALDSDQNLFLVRDALRARLMEDYNPGDASIFIEGDATVISRFPPTGLITLTEQCGDIDTRAISFYYNSRTANSFDELELLPGFADVVKPKRATNVTMNVIDRHHNNLKDALVQVQSVLGDKYDDQRDSVTGRLRRVEQVMFQPKAWFTVDKKIGLAPFTVKFLNRSLRTGHGDVTQEWDFGDGETRLINTSGSAEYDDNLTITKTYSQPGIYTVSLKVSNEFVPEGNEVVFEGMISALAECPEEAIITITPRVTQEFTSGTFPNICASSSSSVAFVPPKIRSVTNKFIEISVEDGRRPNCIYSYAGELLGGSSSSSYVPVDPIVEWTWSLGDDLSHPSLRATNASYSVGGYYDIVLRVDTQFGAFRITKYENSVDIIESTNLWMFNFGPTSNSSSSSGCDAAVVAYEFGLDSETFKIMGNNTLCVTRKDSFLSQSPFYYGRKGSDEPGDWDFSWPPRYDDNVAAQAKREFGRNVEFVRTGSNGSGDRGESILFWAGGGLGADEEKIFATSYNAFADQYESLTTITARPWNWVALTGEDAVYFLFGHDTSTNAESRQNNAYAWRLDFDLSLQTTLESISLDGASFENGAGELLQHPSQYSSEASQNENDQNLPTNGYFAVYRSAWKDSTGYLLRNTSVNELFRISSFYKTKGSVSEPYSKITKLPDMIGSAKLEAQMVALYNGIYVFNNSGEVCAWNDTSLTWEVGRTNSSSLSFRSLQDTTVSSFDNKANTLLATSDGDRTAYLSYDYSTKAFIKFNGTDLTFSALKQRPAGEQFKMGVY